MERFKFFNRREIVKLPKSLGIYVFKSKKEILNAKYSRFLPKAKFLYIGKAKNIHERVKNHFKRPGFKENIFLERTKKIGFIKTDSEIEALILEAKLIKKYQPKYNVIWRDDKNYFFVAKTNEDFPQIFITHQPPHHNGNKTLSAPKLTRSVPVWCGGPFVDGKALKQTLKILRKVFPYRSCQKLARKPCLWYQLDRCLAPCALNSNLGKQIPSAKRKIKKESQNNIGNILKIFKGEKNKVFKKLGKEMKMAVKSQEFEKASKIRDKIFSLKKVVSHSKVWGEESMTENWEETEKELKKIVENEKKISIIEAYDISNIQGQEATGSMIVFIDGKPNKNFYRRFKIKISGKPNDVAMIKEIIQRRFKHKEWPFPDLILIDGGIAQLNAVKSEVPEGLRLFREKGGAYGESKNKKSKKIITMALAKKENKLYIEGYEKSILLKKLPRGIFNLVLQLRDEAHRFALAYHLKLRKKRLIE